MSDFNGRPIEGEPQRFSEPMPPQADPQDFLDALDELLAVEGVEAVRWEAYTPYFNDGDVCEYSTNEPRVKLSFGEEEAGDYGDGWYSTYDLDGSVYDRDTRTWIDGNNMINGHSTVEVKDALSRFGSELGPKHYVVLSEKFGDPAQVTATKAGFEVEGYEHE